MLKNNEAIVLRLFFNGFRIGQLAMVVIGNIQDPW
jgi:hypothetical protein